MVCGQLLRVWREQAHKCASVAFFTHQIKYYGRIGCPPEWAEVTLLRYLAGSHPCPFAAVAEGYTSTLEQ